MDLPKQKPIRAKDFDYSSAGAYFVTVCTDCRRHILSEITVGALIPKIIGYLKMNSSKEIHFYEPNISVWQRSYHDHIIRNEKDYTEIYQYIESNPVRWAEDKYYQP